MPGRALELGAGLGQGAAFLADKGWSVVALDSDPGMIEALEGRFASNHQVEVCCQDMRDFPSGPYRAIFFVFSIFFLPKEETNDLIARLRRDLAPGGVIGGQLLGPDDEWAGNGKVCAHTRAEVESLLDGLEILDYEEANRDGKIVTGEAKHWHVHHFLAQKPARRSNPRG